MLKPISILVADDNRYMRESLQTIISLQRNLLLIGEARNGQEAIILAEELQPDIILMDINMSPVNGFEATSSILKKFPAIKIIGLSLHAEPIYRKNMMSLGACNYIVKSADYDEIISGIQQVAKSKTVEN